jgi:hypothetical protein
MKRYIIRGIFPNIKGLLSSVHAIGFGNNSRFRVVLDSWSTIAALFSIAGVTFCSGLFDSSNLQPELVRAPSEKKRMRPTEEDTNA